MYVHGPVSVGLGRRQSVFFSLLLAGAANTFCQPLAAQSIGNATDSFREAAVASARIGEFESAIATLETLSAADSENILLQYDLATVLAWSENDTAAVELSAAFDPGAAPRYVQIAIAKSARNLQQFELAARWYDAVLAARPDDTDALIGRLLTATDAGDADTVTRLLDYSEPLATVNVELALAHIYALRSSGESIAALAAYDGILAESPGHTEALRGKALLLRDLLLSSQALELALAHPGILTEVELERLRADEIAIQIRIAARTAYPDSAGYSARDHSLDVIEEAFTSTTTAAARNALLLDQVVALADASRPLDAIALFESLPESVRREQTYVLSSVGSAYLQTRRPEEARRVLQRALELQPNHLESQFLLIFAWLDLDQYEEAHALAIRLTQELPMARRSPDQRVVKGNDERIRAEIIAGIADADGNRLAVAQDRFELLLNEAASNSEIRQELALVYRWRGWLDRSLEQYRQALTTNPDLLSARIGLAHAQLEAHQYADVEMAVAEVTQSNGREPAVRQLAELWEVHNQREVQVTASSGESSGPVAGSDHYSIDTSWYTAPLSYHFRAFVTTHDAHAEYPEGQAQRRRLGAGVEMRLPRFIATTAISGSRSGGQTGISAAVAYRRNDYWSVNAGLQSESTAVQLRAHRLGIDADRAYLGVSFTPNELARLNFGFDHASYSDGNSLDAISIDGRRRILSRPRSALDATGAMNFGRASTNDVPYFSPIQSRSATLGLSHRLRILRRYERELNQIVEVAAGNFAQQGFDAGSIWSAVYRIDWSLTNQHSLSFEAQRHGQYFDGTREHSNVFLLSLNSRF